MRLTDGSPILHKISEAGMHIGKGSYRIYPYRGSSMRGTFRPGDLLYVEPVVLEDARPGDVVLFSGEGGVSLVHRVQARMDAGLLTRGDAQPFSDPVPVTPERLVGRVRFYERRGQVRPVWGGMAGRFWAAFLRLRRRLLRAMGAPYRLLRRSGWVRRLWRPAVEQIYLNGPEGPAVKYVHGGRTVACRWPESGRFWCRRPYDLVLDLPPSPPDTGDLP